MTLQAQIAGLLDQRAEAMSQIASIIQQGDAWRAAPAADGVIKDDAAVVAYEASQSLNYKLQVQAGDQEIAALQDRQRVLFETCKRYVPSF